MMTALVVLGSIALFVTLVSILVMMGVLFIQQRDINEILTHAKLNTTHLTTIERLSVGLHSFIAGEIAHQQGGGPPAGGPPELPPNTRRIYRTEDGKYEAESFDGLMRKIADDNSEEIDNMRRAFEEYNEDEPPKLPGDEWKEDDEPEAK